MSDPKILKHALGRKISHHKNLIACHTVKINRPSPGKGHQLSAVPREVSVLGDCSPRPEPAGTEPGSQLFTATAIGRLISDPDGEQ